MNTKPVSPKTTKLIVRKDGVHQSAKSRKRGKIIVRKNPDGSLRGKLPFRAIWPVFSSQGSPTRVEASKCYADRAEAERKVDAMVAIWEGQVQAGTNRPGRDAADSQLPPFRRLPEILDWPYTTWLESWTLDDLRGSKQVIQGHAAHGRFFKILGIRRTTGDEATIGDLLTNPALGREWAMKLKNYTCAQKTRLDGKVWRQSIPCPEEGLLLLRFCAQGWSKLCSIDPVIFSTNPFAPGVATVRIERAEDKRAARLAAGRKRQAALAEGDITTTVVAGNPDHRNAHSVEDMGRMLSIFHETLLHPYVVVGFLTGMRPSEILGMANRCYNRTTGVFSIEDVLKCRRSVHSVAEGRILTQVRGLGLPKTLASTRVIKLPESGRRYFNSYLELRERELGRLLQPQEPVLTGLRGPWIGSHAIFQAATHILTDIGKPIIWYPYLCRHYFSSMCRLAGIPEEVENLLTGHVRPGMAGRYGNLGATERMIEDAATLIESWLVGEALAPQVLLPLPGVSARRAIELSGYEHLARLNVPKRLGNVEYLNVPSVFAYPTRTNGVAGGGQLRCILDADRLPSGYVLPPHNLPSWIDPSDLQASGAEMALVPTSLEAALTVIAAQTQELAQIRRILGRPSAETPDSGIGGLRAAS